MRLAERHPTRFPVPAVDIHNHLGRWRTGKWSAPDVGLVIAVMDDCGVGTVVNLDGCWGGELDANLERYDHAHPGRFVTFARLDWSDCAIPGWAARLAASVRDSARRGAAGFKVWKDVGLRVRDEDGHLVLLDDPRLAPVWEAVEEAGLPVLVHTADPVAFFHPLDARNERLEELLAHPDWRYHNDAFPSFERLLDALEKTVASHPRITFIGAHVGCHSEDLAWVSAMLRAYPHFNVDIADRIAELGRQPRAARRLILDHPSRVLLGTDVFPPQRDVYATYARFLTTDDEHFPYSSSDPPPTGRWAISALDLPAELVAAVVRDNARSLVPAIAGG